MGLPDGRMPEDKLPQCWSDDVRMNALFAPFRLKAANPESWEMKMKFWSDMVRQWCRCRQDPSVSAAEARAAFARKGRQPACLEVVIDQMYRNGDLSPVNKYQQILYSSPDGWMKWGAKLAIRPAVFAVTAVGYLMPKRQLVDNDGLPKASVDASQRFVVEDVVKELALDLLSTYPVGEERVGSVDHLMGICSVEPAGRERFETLLGWLLQHGLAAKQEDVIKLAESRSGPAPRVSATDAARARLAGQARRLAAAAARARAEAAAAARAARAAAQTGDRLAAKGHLRRRHKAESRAAQTEAALDNVRQTLLSMQDMDLNAAVVGTYRMSTEAMKQGMKESGLSEDGVLDTMDDLREALQTCADVERALSPPPESDAELEAELAALLNTGGGGSGALPTEALRLPSPPAAAPGSPARPAAPAGPAVPGSPDFVFDGEARMLAELMDLEVSTPAAGPASPARWQPPQPAQAPRGDRGLRGPRGDRGSLEDLCRGFAELRTDQRLHPGQKLDIDHASPTKLYNTDFQVQDHRLTDGVWVFNAADAPDTTARPSDPTTRLPNPTSQLPDPTIKPTDPTRRLADPTVQPTDPTTKPPTRPSDHPDKYSLW